MKKNKSASTEPKKTNREIAGLLGSVKLVKQICYKAQRKNTLIVKGKIEEEYHDKKNYSVSYNEKGNKTEEHFFYTGGWFNKKSYNQQELPVEETNYYLGGAVMNRITRQYDLQGHLLEEIQYDTSGNASHKIISKFDDAGNMIDHYTTNAEGIIASRTTSKYDAKGRILENITYDAKGETNKNIWQYDDQGGIIDVCAYIAGSLISRYTQYFKYNKEGIKYEHSTEHFIAAKNETRKSVFKCNDHGDPIEAHHYNPDGSLAESRMFEYQYDEHGNKIIEADDDEEEKLKSETEECENDSHGNWIKKTTYYGSSDAAWKKIPVNLYFRELTYWGEESPDENSIEHFFADIKSAHDENEKNEGNHTNPMEELSPEQLRWMAEVSNSNDPFPIFRYYALTNEEMPSLLSYTGPYIEALALLDELKENLNAQMLYSYYSIWNQQDETLARYILSFPDHPGFLLHAIQISSQIADEFEVPAFMNRNNDYSGSDYVYFSQLQLLRPSDVSGKLEEYGDEDEFARELNDYINKCSLKKKPDKPVINMIEVAGNGFSVVEHAVDDNFEIKDLDVNYGYGFAKFHNELMQRFNTSTKGLVLFHGQPGTGKTYYIRHLLRKMASSKKVVIYMPPNMVDHLVDPGFMTFLSGEIRDWSANGNFCVLLIEDAEPLLAKRQEGVRIQGVTNLLNMTDGLLNDMLNLQIICTFNVDLRKLDSALLRPGRLIARKEFKALSQLDANLLAQRLGIKHHFKAPATLGEIYSFGKNKNTLIHDVEPEKGASTQIDDLL